MDVGQKTLRVFAAAVICAISVLVGQGAPEHRPTAPAAPAAPAAPVRIVSIVPAVTEMLFAINAGSQVVGVGSYDHFPAEADRLPKVGALLDPDFEKILSLRPDLVVAYGTQADFIARLQRASIPIFLYDDAGLSDITATIRRLGERVGHATDANTLASGIEHDLDGIRARVATQPKVKTLLVFGREPGSLRGIYASGGVGFLHELLVVAGGIDAFDDVKRQNVVISSEQVLARAPEVIIELHRSDSTDTQLASERDVWRQLAAVPAVRNNRIFLLRGDFLTVPGPRIAQAARMFADSLHPMKQ